MRLEILKLMLSKNSNWDEFSEIVSMLGVVINLVVEIPASFIEV